MAVMERMPRQSRGRAIQRFGRCSRPLFKLPAAQAQRPTERLEPTRSHRSAKTDDSLAAWTEAEPR